MILSSMTLRDGCWISASRISIGCSEQVIEAYQLERDRWARNRSTVRMARVRSLLSADEVDIDAMELKLGYRLRRYRLGVVVWFREQISGVDRLLLLERPGWSAERAGGVRRCSSVRPGRRVKRLGLGPRSAPSARSARLFSRTRSLTARCDVHVYRENRSGQSGNLPRTHQQALRAQAVALAAGPAGPRVTAFADIRPIALMSSDLDSEPRLWGTRVVFGDLAIWSDEPHAWVPKSPSRVPLHRGSYTAAAVRLSMHKNSVHYRVQKAEEILRRPVRIEERLEVELALLACHWLGPAVLSVAPDGQAATNHAS